MGTSEVLVVPLRNTVRVYSGVVTCLPSRSSRDVYLSFYRWTDDHMNIFVLFSVLTVVSQLLIALIRYQML